MMLSANFHLLYKIRFLFVLIRGFSEVRIVFKARGRFKQLDSCSGCELLSRWPSGLDHFEVVRPDGLKKNSVMCPKR